jgi:pyruvate/2-oxoglutarate dehydrogenase complex dihydrolipoamide acyltransferase (E2) component
MPKPGLTMKTGVILKWYKNEGEKVRKKNYLR